MKTLVYWMYANDNDLHTFLDKNGIAGDLSLLIDGISVPQNFKGTECVCSCVKTYNLVGLTENSNTSQAVCLYDSLYKQILSISVDAVIIPLTNWRLLQGVKKSYLQLSNKHVLFVLEDLPESDEKAFMDLVRYIDRFRNIHVAICQPFDKFRELERCYNLHFFPEEKLEEVLKLHINVRRKYIGWRHHLNELRQKIKFHKDLFVHLFKVKFDNPYKEQFARGESIPKVVHYCWFGGKPMPEKVQKLVDSWKIILPDYEFKCWNESNFPFEKYRFASEALANKKWAFIADVARLHALYYEGGLYFDTDVELLKSFDEFLKEDGFTSYESLNLIAMAAMGFKKYHPWVAETLMWYQSVHCDDDYTEIANTKVVSKITRLHYGVKLDGKDLRLPCGLHIYPREYFSPKSEKDKWLSTENTHCIHHFTGMW